MYENADRVRYYSGNFREHPHPQQFNQPAVNFPGKQVVAIQYVFFVFPMLFYTCSKQKKGFTKTTTNLLLTLVTI